MKIIFQGSIPKPQPNRSSLLPMKCGNCKTVVQHEEEDKTRYRSRRRSRAKRWMEIDCPSCGEVIQHDEAPKLRVIPEDILVDTPAYYFPSSSAGLRASDAEPTMSCINFLGATVHF